MSWHLNDMGNTETSEFFKAVFSQCILPGIRVFLSATINKLNLEAVRTAGHRTVVDGATKKFSQEVTRLEHKWWSRIQLLGLKADRRLLQHGQTYPPAIESPFSRTSED